MSSYRSYYEDDISDSSFVYHHLEVSYKGSETFRTLEAKSFLCIIKEFILNSGESWCFVGNGGEVVEDGCPFDDSVFTILEESPNKLILAFALSEIYFHPFLLYKHLNNSSLMYVSATYVHYTESECGSWINGEHENLLFEEYMYECSNLEEAIAAVPTNCNFALKEVVEHMTDWWEQRDDTSDDDDVGGLATDVRTLSIASETDVKKKRGAYKCRICKQPKKGHTCSGPPEA